MITTKNKASMTRRMHFKKDRTPLNQLVLIVAVSAAAGMVGGVALAGIGVAMEGAIVVSVLGELVAGSLATLKVLGVARESSSF